MSPDCGEVGLATCKQDMDMMSISRAEPTEGVIGQLVEEDEEIDSAGG